MVIALIAGGHAAGKRSTATLLENEIKSQRPGCDVVLVDMSKYENITPRPKSNDSTPSALKVHPGGLKSLACKPSRFDFAALRNDLASHSDKIFVVHGLYALYDKELREMAQIRVFIDSDPDTRLIRWIRKDVLPEGSGKRSLDDVISEYLHCARAEMSDYIFPTKEFADVIMPRGAETSAVQLIYDGLFGGGVERKLFDMNNYLRPSRNGKSIFYELN